MVSFIEVFKTLADNKIFSRVTASSTILGGLFVLNNYFVNQNVNPEVLALIGVVMGSAGTFLFMAEKD